MKVKTYPFYGGGERIEYTLKGQLHNPNGPAVRELNKAGMLILEEYWLHNQLYNPSGPTCREWNKAGVLICEKYWLNGRLHNPNGPALRMWNRVGVLLHEIHYLNGKRHSLLGPAIREWDDTGTLLREEYCVDGRRHNDTGPAHILYICAMPIEKRYYLKGVKLKEDDWRDQTKPPEIIAVISVLHRPIADAIIAHYCRA
jgi:hypothetical protein